MFYGSGRLIDVRESVNLRLLNRPVVFNDIYDPNVSFWGLYTVHPFELLPDGHADLYYLGYENKQGIFDQGTGYELRHSIGTRLWGHPLPWKYDVEAL